MTLNEKQIKDIISESIKTRIAEEHIKQTIKKMVRESLENFGGFSQYESSDKEDGRLSDMNTESDNDAETRDSIENFFKQPGVNNAPYAYKLYGVEAKEGQDTNDMKNARKKFADCVNHEKNENGYPYSFDSDELNTLKGMISGNQLDEAIGKAMRKVLSELDYKTYLNAAKKRAQQGHSRKAHDLMRYGQEKFNQQYGYEDDNSRVGWDDLTGVSRRDKNVFNQTYREFIDDDGKHKSMTVGGWNDQCDVKRNPNDPNPHLQKAHQEYTDYVNGKYQYSQDKGWHKDN